MAELDKLFRIMTAQGASDLHLSAGSPPYIRVHGDMTALPQEALSTEQVQGLIFEILTEKQRRVFIENWELDCTYQLAGVGRFRCNVFMQRRGMGGVFRVIPEVIKTVEELSLPKVVNELINYNRGLVLVTGPTGSGKSTTLYSLLNEIDRESYNVLSLEDPVEYTVEGVSQSQVRPEIDYSFASGLRTTLRQDPDIIMVGEIRDKETAQLAVQAALTGHLVFSTLHTNNAAGVIPRLIDMGVDPYLIAPTLILSIGQRLVGTLCPGSGEPMPVDGSIKAMVERQFADLPLEFKKDIVIPNEVYKVKPTPECPKGTRGRMAVFEMFEMDKDIEKAILTNPTETEITKIVRAKGMTTIKENAILKAFEKIIPFEEVNKL